MEINKSIEKDISESLFFLKPKYFFDFFFFFFFKCLYAILFDFIYILIHKRNLIINKSLISDNKKAIDKNILFVGDSTISFPNQNYSFPYLFFENMNIKNVDILAKPGLNSEKLYEYIKPILDNKNKKFDQIFVACFMNEIISPKIKENYFKEKSIILINFLKKHLKENWKINYIYGNISLHTIVPNNYFKKYFDYKTRKFIHILKSFELKDFEFNLLMDFKENESKKDIKTYFYKDWLHFSKKWQIRLFEDLKNSLSQ